MASGAEHDLRASTGFSFSCSPEKAADYGFPIARRDVRLRVLVCKTAFRDTLGLNSLSNLLISKPEVSSSFCGGVGDRVDPAVFRVSEAMAASTLRRRRRRGALDGA